MNCLDMVWYQGHSDFSGLGDGNNDLITFKVLQQIIKLLPLILEPSDNQLKLLAGINI